jgi:asparagine synthase (glutamine-hydrolysing)
MILVVTKMCGIAGFFNEKLTSQERDFIAGSMANSLKHRGPDGNGTWNSGTGLSLVHTRLAIIDTSSLGHQPMKSANSKWMVSFNGEIYNYKELRDLLHKNSCVLKGNSDTEVLVNLLEVFGLEKTLSLISGMFAIAAYDIANENLHLIRDRLGEKPLYYSFTSNTIVFASELKSFHCVPFWTKVISRESLALYFKYNYIPQPHSIFEKTYKVPQGHCVSFNLKNISNLKSQQYWSPDSNKINLTSNSEKNIIDNLESKLLSVVKQEMVSDVPLGSFLSGGIDSTLITAMMQAQSSVPIKTFTIGFENQSYDESKFARSVADHLECQHTEWIFTENDLKDLIPNISDIYGEPFSDSSQLPTYLLSKMTRSQVTVSLSGDGGDELFGGYTRYQWAEKSWKVNKSTPAIIKKAIKYIISAVKEEKWNSVYEHLKFMFPERFQVSHIGSKLYKFKDLLDSESDIILYDKLLSHLYDPSSILNNQISLTSRHNKKADETFLKYMMRHDSSNYLPDDIMVKVDRASMAVSLETRAPFLHHEVYEYANALPMNLKIKNGNQKYILKMILENYIPKKLIHRPKMGFGIPLQSWLSTDLKSWVCDTLNKKELEKHNLLNSSAIEKILDNYYNKNHNLSHQIWDLVIFQSWYNRWMEKT